MVDLLRLKIFLHAAENLNFSEAARILHLTQPTVSHHIKILEQEFGVELFTRQGSAIKLTDAGRLLVPWAKKVVRDSIEMQDIMESLKEGIAGNLYIACSTTAGKYVLPQLAARFSFRHPKIKTTLLRCSPETVIPNMLDGDANLGVISYEIRDKEMELQEFFQDSISIIVPQNHPFISRSKILPEDLIGEPIIMREETSGTRKIVLSELAKHDISLDDLNIFMQVGNAEAIIRTVAAGYGISFVSKLAAAPQIEKGNVVIVSIEGINLVRTIYMVRKRLEASNRPQDAFWSFVHDESNQDIIEMAGPDAADMKPTRDSLGIPVNIYKMLQNDRDLDLQTLATIIKTWEKKELKLREIAVLSRSGSTAKIKRGLTHFGIELATGSFFSEEAVVGALNYLWLALHPADPQALESAMGYPGPSLGLMTRSMLECERVSWDELAWLISDSQFAATEKEKALNMFRRHARNHHVLLKYSNTGNVSVVVEQLLAPLHDTLLKEGWFPSASDVEQLVEMAGEFDTLPRFTEHLRREVENVKYTQDGVSVMTIHKSKGTEFRGVIIPGWIDGLIPADTDDPQTEKNLAYVGMTRAMDRLALTVPGTPPSPYLRGMRETSVIHV